MGAINYNKTVTFTAGTTSTTVDLGAETLLGIEVPANLTGTANPTLTIQGANTKTAASAEFATVEAVDQAMTVTPFAFTIDGVNLSRYSFGGSFPPDERFLRFTISATATGTIKLRTMGI